MPRLAKEQCTNKRIYVETEIGHPIVDKLRELGLHWDSDVRMWWCGRTIAKLAEIHHLLAQNPGPAKMVEVAGNGYPVREALRRMGGRVTKEVREGKEVWVWRVPEGNVYKAKRVIAEAAIHRAAIHGQGRCTECDAWGPSGQSCRHCGGEGTHH